MKPNNRPTSDQLLMDIIREAISLGCEVQMETVRYKTGDSSLLVRIADKYPGLDKGIFLLTTGIHANEIAGPLTTHQRLPEILACTRVVGLQLVLYPLICASGWDLGTEQNVDGDSGDDGNNDYLRRRTIDGKWTWKLSDNDPCWEWCYSSDPILGIHLPAETLAMHTFLQQEDWSNIKVALDIHQDYLTPDVPAGAYQYTFGDTSCYNDIFGKIRKLTDILGDRDFQFDRKDPTSVRHYDHNGCTEFHDGSITDLAYQQRVPYALAIETTGPTPIEIAIEVNMIWIRGLCDIISHTPTGETMSQQASKPPDPFDLPSEEARMVNEGGHDPKPDSSSHLIKPIQTSTTPDTVRTDDYGDLATSVREALESFQRLNRGEPAPKVIVHVDENDKNHVSASWEKPKSVPWRKPKKWF